MITALVILVICAVVGTVGGFAVWWITDVVEQRLADFEWGRIWPARTFQVALPYLAEGSWHQAAPRALRTGPLYPLDVPGRVPPQTHARPGTSSVPLPATTPVPSGTVPPHLPPAAGTWPEAAPPSPPPATETSIDMDSWLIELLTCPKARIKTAARQSLKRYEAQTRREVAAYLRGLGQVTS